MANIVCAISALPFKCSYVPMTLSRREYEHPIFHLTQKKLLDLYASYNEDKLTDIESYLLFVALLKSTDSVTFSSPCELTTSTAKIVAANIGNLVSIIWQSNVIQHPSFKQPRFFIRKDTSNLDNIKVWIKAWESNINDFKSGMDRESMRDKLQKVENTLSKFIHTPEAGKVRLASATAEWADKAAEFPSNKRDAWKLIIRKCYNLEAMFSTSKSDLIEIKLFCEDNIEAGSIHYHTLMKTLRTGIANHNDFLGLGAVSDIGGAGYTLLPTDTTIEDANILSIIDKAPDSIPVQSSYPTKLAFLRAKTAYIVAVRHKKVTQTKPEVVDDSTLEDLALLDAKVDDLRGIE